MKAKNEKGMGKKGIPLKNEALKRASGGVEQAVTGFQKGNTEATTFYATLIHQTKPNLTANLTLYCYIMYLLTDIPVPLQCKTTHATHRSLRKKIL
jgi:hypothetical protein